MSITALHQSATGLQDQGTPARPLSDPSCRLRGIDVELPGAGGNKSGICECGAGRFGRPLPNAEVMHILAGSAPSRRPAAKRFRFAQPTPCSFRRTPRANGMCASRASCGCEAGLGR